VILITAIIFERIARTIPLLKIKLKQADMKDQPEEFIKKTIISSLYMAAGLTVFLFLILVKFHAAKILFFVFPILFFILFFYLLKLPDVKIRRKEREINKEVVFAGRFLIIEIESGVPLYNALANLSRNYVVIGKYFREITDKVRMGTTMEDALNETVEVCPSRDFRRVLWQIINSLRTGSDIASSLEAILEQIAREQAIEIKRYGRKLNPLAMFYMIIAVILPSLGITMLIILSTFLNLELDIVFLVAIAFFLGFLQFMFLAVIRFSRPSIEL